MPTYKWPKVKNQRGFARDRIKPINPEHLNDPAWKSTKEKPVMHCDGCGSMFNMEKDDWYSVKAPSRILVLCDECAEADVDRAKSEGRLKPHW
jgi:hypothetical protein